MPDALPAVPASAVPVAAPPSADPGLSAGAMSLDDYARVVGARSRFVDFLLAPARGRLADAA